jgi:acylphosphatase
MFCPVLNRGVEGMTEIEKIVAVRIRGRVQGVGFRAFVQSEAESFHVKGWVRNRANGDVEALFAGTASAVDELIAACRRGPDHARVTDLSVDEAKPDEFARVSSGFRTLPTI